MNPMLFYTMPRTACLVIGYFFGCILTGAFVVKLKTGKSVSEFGTGNPGMANIMRVFGFKTGIIVLIGDLLKTVAACLLCLYLFGGKHLSDPNMSIGQISALWAGLGTVLGHNWPFWRKFSGGKGVAVTCMAIFLFSPIWGLIADLAGMLVVMTTGFLPLGAVVITTLFAILCYLFCTTEAAILALILAVIMFSRHWRGLLRILQGKEERHAQYIKLFKSKDAVSPEENVSDISHSQMDNSDISASGMNPSGISASGMNPSDISASGMNDSGVNPSGMDPSVTDSPDTDTLK